MEKESEEINVSGRWVGMKKNHQGYIYILPWVVGFLLFQLYPFVVSFAYSWTNIRIAGSATFIGWENYKRLFITDTDFLHSLSITVQYVLITVPGKLLVSLVFALLLNRALACMRLFRTVYYLPSILGGSVAISALWRVMFMHTGIVNNLTARLGFPPLNWLGDPSLALFTISLVEIWQFGSAMVIFLAALKQVPAELYDAVTIDGGGSVRAFFTISLPLITPQIQFNLVMQTINALQNFTSAFVVTQGGPIKSTYLLGLKLYEDAFSRFNMGYASAQSWVLFLLVLTFTLLVFSTSKYWVFYYDGGK